MSGHRYKILIVDDVIDNILILNEILEVSYQVVFATSGRKAIDMAGSLFPDLILLDIMMPEMDGYQVCQRLKSDEITKDIPIIFLTALSEEENEMMGLSMGAIDFIAKPVNPEIVRLRVKNYLELKERREQLMQLEKIASIGSIVSSMALEINNPFGVIITVFTHFDSITKEFAARLIESEVTRQEIDTFISKIGRTNELMLSSISKITDLINSFTMISTSQYTYKKKVFNLRSYIDYAILCLKPNLKTLSNPIDIDCPAGIEADSYPAAFTQIITNLILNSITHGLKDMPNGRIKITVAEDGGDIVMRFNDNGCGIPEDNLRHIYEPFFTSDRRSGNLGLGLSSVHNIVIHTLRGRINCESVEGAGTTFTITFPKNPQTF